MKEQNQNADIVSADVLLETLFKELQDSKANFDESVVELVIQHLGQESIHSQAGANLANALLLHANPIEEEVKKQ
jgi:hypothetical protein